MYKAMIEISHMTKTYSGGMQVLKDINATIHKGEVISIIGPSGSGKSTLLRCLNLLEKPTGGSIKIDGKDLLSSDINVSKIRQKMGMVFQSFNLFNHLSVIDNLCIGPIKLLGKSRQEAEKRAMELLEIVGLAEKARVMPSMLSGGQKQRIAIARCLSMDPEIILFDEPTSALDPTMISEVQGVIRKLAHDGMTMIITTHEMRFARDVSTRVFYLDQGVIYEEGTPEQIFENPLKERTRIFVNRIRDMHYVIHSSKYDLYSLHSQIEYFSNRYLLPHMIMFRVQLLTDEVLQFMPLDKGEINLTLRYSEIEGTVLLELLMPTGVKSVLGEKKYFPDELSLSIINGLCDKIEEEIVECQSEDKRLLLRFILAH